VIGLALVAGEASRTYKVGEENEIDNLTLVETICDAPDTRFTDDPGPHRRFPNAVPVRGRRCRELITFVEACPTTTSATRSI
jgi:dTDP-D-glucose 4,6-dehydratase